MASNLAAKRLTQSDLSIFEEHFGGTNRQKAINLNKDPFIKEFYPALPEEGRASVDVVVFGPGIVGAIEQNRDIILQQKNWRLNGKLIENPREEPDRFTDLEPGDMVLFRFDGDRIPEAVAALFVASNLGEDHELHQRLDRYLGNSSMEQLDHSDLFDIEDELNLSERHGLYSLLHEAAYSDVAAGDDSRSDVLTKGPTHPELTRDELAQRKTRTEEIGRQGEKLVNGYLRDCIREGRIQDFEWVSDDNAVAPFDFSLQINEENIYVDVKSTTMEFGQRLHISQNELKKAAQEESRYDIYRVFELSRSGAKMRAAENIGPQAKEILTQLDALPDGVKANGVSIDPKILDFGSEVVLKFKSSDTTHD